MEKMNKLLRKGLLVDPKTLNWIFNVKLPDTPDGWGQYIVRTFFIDTK